ncbi:protein mab-21-like 3 [Stylophora pistillata]|uniref:protein mab-21-like 3 n=1 Tax=Stylophora pistillata TaxID=50429 RepID=UPI000C04237D|nr:protein mab-21-like 3 [Stylophora pistillata]
MKAALENFLKKHADAFVRYRRKKLMEIENIINPLLEGVKKLDEKFDFEMMNCNSFYIIKSPIHYEVLLNFHGVDPEEISVEDGQAPAGFTLVRLSGKKMVSRWKFCSGNSNPSKVYLSAKTVREKLFELSKRVIASSSYLGLLEARNFCVEVTDDDEVISLRVSGHDVEAYSVDLLPAIPCPGRWVFSAHAWESKQADWTSKTLKEEVIKSGFHLVARPSPSRSSYQWQIDFPGPMRKLLEVNMGCRIKCLLILEIIMGDMHSQRDTCDSFQLETIVLRITEHYPVKSFWSEENFSKRFLDTVIELQRCLSERSLTQIFIPAVNLFQNFDKVTLKRCEEVVRSVLADPENFLNAFQLFQYTTAL